MRFAIVFTVAAQLLRAQSAEEILARGRTRLNDAMDRMPRYTCTQTIDRNYFEPLVVASTRLACDEVVAMRKPDALKWIGMDRLRLDVMVAEEGAEVFSWPGGRSLSMQRLEGVSGEGPIGTGGFGPFLINIFGAPGVQFYEDGRQSLDGRNTWRFRYRVPLEASHYRVIAADRTRIVPFDGRFWLDAESADLLQLTVRTGELSPATGNCEATTTVDFSRVKVGLGEYLLPSKSILRVVRRDRAESENTTVYASCHEFHGDSTIRFDDSVTESNTTAAEDRRPAYPAGVQLVLALTAPIRTADAAAGDFVEARLTKAVPPKGRTDRAIPAGTRVRGRITALQQRGGNIPYVAVTLAWEEMERKGKWVPFAARLDEPARMLEFRSLYSKNTQSWHTSGRRAPPAGDTLVYRTSDPRFVVEAGKDTHWLSIPSR